MSCFSRDHAVLSRQKVMWLFTKIEVLVTLVLIVHPSHTLGCVFDCHFDFDHPSENFSVCYGKKPEILEMVQQHQTYMLPGMWADFVDEPSEKRWEHPFLAVNLVGRTIEAIADGGFDCYDFIPYGPGGNEDDDGNGEDNPSPVLRGLLLDDNILTSLPNMSTLGLLNVSYVSMARNSISKFDDSGAPFTNMISSGVQIILDNNEINELPAQIIHGFNSGNEFILSLNDNVITELPVGLFSGDYQCNFVAIMLNSNLITDLPRAFFNNTNFIDYVRISLDYNRISHFPSGVFLGDYDLESLILTVTHNRMLSVPSEFFRGVSSAGYLFVVLDDNEITILPQQFYNGTCDGGYSELIYVSLTNNNIEVLPASLFSALAHVAMVTLYVDNNRITNTNEVFRGWNSESTVTVSLRNNFVTEIGLQIMLGSYTNVTGPLVLDVGGNNVAFVPSYLFAGIGNGIIANFAYPTISLNLSDNILTLLPTSVFDQEETEFGLILPVRVNNINLDLSDNPDLVLSNYFDFPSQSIGNLMIQLSRTNQETLPLAAFQSFGQDQITPSKLVLNLTSNNIQMNTTNTFDSNTFISNHVTIDLILQNNSITSIPVYSFNNFKGTLDLSFNNITRLVDNSFFKSHLQSINLSNNQLVEVEPNTFHISVYLVELDLSYNLLTNVTANFTDNTPVLQRLLIKGNQVLSAPLLIGNSRIFEASNAEGNVLQCQVYSPQLQNCTCKGDLVFNEFCGYGRCTPTITGCSTDGELPTDDCSAAPRSICVSKCSSGYLSSSNALGGNKIATCIPYTNCSTTFGQHTQGYEFQAATRTTNRVCSACSVCSAGFDSTPCTATSNTVCTRTLQLTIGDISAIVVTVILVFVGTAGGTSYVFMRKKEEKKEHELELSQMLLGEVNEENSRMRKAWEICEDDLHIEKKLASGSFGVVWSATWGHIPVAVKTLHAHLAELPSEMVEFEREAIFMQSIRHPNLLIFYGAGIKTNGTPFLVVELMDKGSMGKLIKSESLPWSTRRRFALEVAQGMAHLHSLDSLHRDLKSDNCLVDDKLHVKVGDFGNSRLMSAYYGDGEMQQNTYVAETRRASDRSDRFKSLTSEVGTLLWMAPELLIGGNKAYGKEVDMFSFGIVMWELLSMEFPWDNHFNDAPSLIVIRRELTQMLLSGKRPTLPEHSNDTDYAPYIALMKRCWATQADTRPPFASVAALLADIAGCEIGCLRTHCD